MTGKERMQNALMCKQPEDSVPIWELEFHCWNTFSSERSYFGVEFTNLSEKEKDYAIEKNAQIIAQVSNKLNFSAVTVPGSYWEVAPGMPSYYWLPKEYKEKQIKAISKELGNDIMMIATTGGIMTMPGAENYMEFCYMLFDAPEEIDNMALSNFEMGVEGAKLMSELGVGAVVSASDIADNHGLFFNPEQMDRYILPYMGKWSEEVKKLGMCSILHTDGNITDAIENIAQSGLNAVQAIDPIAGMDIFKLKETVNDRLCLCGNIDCGILLTGTADEVERLTVKTLEGCKAGGGYVLGASNAVQTEVSKENYSAVIKGWEKAGRY